MKKTLFFVAVVGWVLSLIIHVFSIAAINLTANFPFAWGLHLGVFVVWVPTILDLRNQESFKTLPQAGQSNRVSRGALFHLLFQQIPVWLRVLAIGGFFYAMVNFMLFLTHQSGVPDFQNGQYILHNHGQLIRVITAEEYNHFRANEVRGFSGHWLAFYGIAAAIGYPYGSKQER